jgi:hypothetical protein
MALEDSLIGAVRKLREMGLSLVDLATKVTEEVMKDKSVTPEGATSQPVTPGQAPSAGDSVKKEEVIPDWAACCIQDLPPSNGVFRFAAETYQLMGGSVLVRDERGVLSKMQCARSFQSADGSDRFTYFHPLCKVLAPKK